MKKVDLKTWWICAKKADIGCKVSATVLKKENDFDVITGIRGTHEHDSDLMKKAAASVLKEHGDQAASNPNILPRSVMANITSDLQNQAATRDAGNVLPKKATISKQIQRASHREKCQTQEGDFL